MKKILTVAFCLLGIFLAQAAPAQDKPADALDLQALKNAALTDKKALVATTLALTAAESKRFWPLYDAYQRRLATTNKQRTVAFESLISRDKPLSDAFARNLANELMFADEAELRARRTLHNGLMNALPARKAARYMQVEAKLRAVAAHELATAFELVK